MFMLCYSTLACGILNSAIKPEKYRKSMQIGIEEIKLLIHIWHDFLHIKPQEIYKNISRTNKWA